MLRMPQHKRVDLRVGKDMRVQLRTTAVGFLSRFQRNAQSVADVLPRGLWDPD